MNDAGIDNPLVSVMMNCRNGKTYLREALDSLYAQSYKNWEIVFWDNASSDGSADIAKSYGSKLRYFKSDQYLTLGRARNMALAEVRGRYLTFLDSDDKSLPDKLEKQVGVLENRRDIDFVYGNYFRLIMPDTGALVRALKGRQPEEDVFGDFLCNYPVYLQTVMLRMDTVRNLNAKFDERLELSEEFDFFMRILFKSKALYIDEPLAIYRFHRDMASYRLSHNHPIEVQYILDKLKKMDPSVERKYAPQIKYYEAKLGYLYAKVAMERRDPISARLRLAPYRFFNFVFFILYILTYLSPDLWKRIHGYKLKGGFRWIS